MNAKELATLLNGNEYRNEISDELEQKAKENALVVVFGHSDDNAEFRGAIHDEVGCYDGGVIPITKKGILHNECEEHDCPYFEKIKEKSSTVASVWCPEELECSWLFKSEISHETFDIMEDGELYCRGIVFSINDVK